MEPYGSGQRATKVEESRTRSTQWQWINLNVCHRLVLRRPCVNFSSCMTTDVARPVLMTFATVYGKAHRKRRTGEQCRVNLLLHRLVVQHHCYLPYNLVIAGSASIPSLVHWEILCFSNAIAPSRTYDNRLELKSLKGLRYSHTLTTASIGMEWLWRISVKKPCSSSGKVTVCSVQRITDLVIPAWLAPTSQPPTAEFRR